MVETIFIELQTNATLVSLTIEQGVSCNEKFRHEQSFPIQSIVELPNICFPNTEWSIKM